MGTLFAILEIAIVCIVVGTPAVVVGNMVTKKIEEKKSESKEE